MDRVPREEPTLPDLFAAIPDSQMGNIKGYLHHWFVAFIQHLEQLSPDHLADIYRRAIADQLICAWCATPQNTPPHNGNLMLYIDRACAAVYT